jgi:hypothetical protein
MNLDTGLIIAVLAVAVPTLLKVLSLSNRFGRLEEKVETHAKEIERLRDFAEPLR